MSQDLESELSAAEDVIAQYRRDFEHLATTSSDEIAELKKALEESQEESNDRWDRYLAMRDLHDNAVAIAEKRERQVEEWVVLARDLASELRNYRASRECWQLAEFDDALKSYEESR